MIIHNDQQKGIALVLTALLLVVIVSFVALAIDTSKAHAAKREWAFTTQRAVLAALEKYITDAGNEPPGATTTVADIIASAVAKAETITGANLNLTFANAFLKEPSKPLNDLSLYGTGDVNGFLEVGLWSFDALPGVNPFVRQPNTARLEDVNAIRLTLHLHTDSPLSNLFGGVFGQSYFTFTTVATASLVPRHGVIAIDLSDSITNDSHHDYLDTACGTSGKCRAQFAYKGNTITGNPSPPFCHAIADNLLPSDGFKFSTLIASRPIGDTSLTTHYQDEYECREVLNTGDPTEPDKFYWIDTRSNSAEPRAKPQPLAAVLDSIHEALVTFQSRSVSGDLIGVLGFGETQPVFPIRELIMTQPGTGDYPSWVTATDTSNVDNYLTKLLIPDHEFTNGVAALNDAIQMLRGAPGFGTFSDSFIIMITDGLVNCSSDAGGPSCGAQQRDYEDAMDIGEATGGDLFATRTLLSGYNIKLHVVMIGDATLPHQALLKNGSRCGTDAEARLRGGLEWTSSAIFPTWYIPGGPTASDPFTDPNVQLWNAAAASKAPGLFLPVMPPCLANTDLIAPLDTHCRDHASANWQSPTGSTGNTDLDSGIETEVGTGHQFITCDALGRTKGDQVLDAMRVITSLNPFILVE